MRRGYRPPWQHEWRAVPCLFCGNAERVVLVSAGNPDIGVCEACAVHVHWTWRTLAGDASPTDDAGRVTKIKVIVSRLAKREDGELCEAARPESYEIAMLPGADGYHDLPTAELLAGETEVEAASRALASAGLSTWPAFLEPLYTAHTQRGSLVRIYVATAYVDVSTQAPTGYAYQWRRWPPWQHARGLYGLYVGLREIWQLRIWKHKAKEPRTEQITTHVRKAAAEYIRLQQLLREDPSTDASMATYLRQSMSDDEKAVCKMVVEGADLAVEREAERGVDAEVVKSGEYREGDVVSEEADSALPEESEAGTLEEAFGEEDERG